MTEAEARRLAAEEGLVLVPAENTSGWKCVSRSLGHYSNPFMVSIKQGGKSHSLGRYSSAAAAALAYARHLGPAGCAAATAPPTAPDPPMTEAEARRLAAAEGLVLVPADNRTGWKGVHQQHGYKRVSRNGVRFQARLWQGGEQHSLGAFASTAEAALAVARFLGPASCATAATAAAATAAPEPPLMEAEARRLAAAEGMQLVILDAVPVRDVKRARIRFFISVGPALLLAV